VSGSASHRARRGPDGVIRQKRSVVSDIETGTSTLFCSSNNRTALYWFSWSRCEPTMIFLIGSFVPNVSKSLMYGMIAPDAPSRKWTFIGALVSSLTLFGRVAEATKRYSFSPSKRGVLSKGTALRNGLTKSSRGWLPIISATSGRAARVGAAARKALPSVARPRPSKRFSSACLVIAVGDLPRADHLH
jgi:hypothetical protein